MGAGEGWAGLCASLPLTAPGASSCCRPRLREQQNVKRDTPSPPCPQLSPSLVSFPGLLWGPDPYSDPSWQGWAWNWGRAGVGMEWCKEDWKGRGRACREGLFCLLLYIKIFVHFRFPQDS